MGDTRHNSFQLNWSSTLNANPYNSAQSVNLSGVNTGTMTGTSTIYSNVQDVSYMQNIGLEVTWTGTAVGTISILVSESGNNFYPLAFSPALTQPAGTAGGYVIDLNQLPFRYYAVQYTNSSSTGTLTIVVGQKDVG